MKQSKRIKKGHAANAPIRGESKPLITLRPTRSIRVPRARIRSSVNALPETLPGSDNSIFRLLDLVNDLSSKIQKLGAGYVALNCAGDLDDLMILRLSALYLCQQILDAKQLRDLAKAALVPAIAS